MTAIQLMKNNVTIFNNNSIANAINIYLDNKGKKSANTRKNYEIWINEFFAAIVEGYTGFSSLTWEKVEAITYQDVCLYQKHLEVAKGNSNKTINAKLAGVKSLWTELLKSNRNIDVNAMTVEPLPLPEENPNSWGSLTEEEVNSLYEFCMTVQYKPLVQKIYFELCFVTGIRYKALLDLTIEQLEQRVDKSTGKKIWCLCVNSKGKDVVKPVSDEMYSRLKSIFEKGSNKVFNVCDKYLRQTLTYFCNKKGIGEDRKIVLHSLKKASMDFVYENTKDIVKTASHGGHKGIQTSYDYYLGKNTSLVDQASYELFDTKFDITMLEGLTKEELLERISKCGIGMIRQLVEVK
jgi:site-specific recombinase XerD